MFIVPTMQHLRNLKLTIAYRELPESEAQLSKWAPLEKWKNDPDADRFYGFAPSNKYYLNGELVSEDKPGLCPVSSSPFPEKRLPRRGLVVVNPDDPDYVRLCKEQGIEDVASATNSPLLPNGVHSSPTNAASHHAVQNINGVGSPARINTATVNGNGQHPISPTSEPGAAQPNGTQGMVNGGH